MPVLNKLGDTNPFLHVTLLPGDKVYAESDAMVMMEANLSLEGKMQGGFMNALARKFANDESFFLQELSAPNGQGDALFAPSAPGDIEILEVGPVQYMVNDGAFVLCTEQVQMAPEFQNPINALFGGSGGWVVTKTQGQGQLVVAGLGAIFSIDVDPAKDVIVDNYHVVAWDSRLQYTASMSTSGQKRGFFKNLLESQLTGEGIVTRFSGKGKVYICSRNPQSFAQFVQSMASPGKHSNQSSPQSGLAAGNNPLSGIGQIFGD